MRGKSVTQHFGEIGCTSKLKLHFYLDRYFGNCGWKWNTTGVSDNSRGRKIFTKCEWSDIRCGLLQCSHTSNLESPALSNNLHYYKNLTFGKTKCYFVGYRLTVGEYLAFVLLHVLFTG